MTLTKAQIVEAVAEQNSFPKNKSSEIVEILLELVKINLELGDDILISGFGKFCVREKNERRGRNPATGEDMMMAPRRIVTFRWSRNLKEKLNQ
jgi:integration host factor subunit alpha